MLRFYIVAAAITFVALLAVSASAQARYQLCNATKTRCVTITMPEKGKCRDIFGYWVCHGRPRK